ncbi:MAG: hypothetical protein VX589_08205 [Myxococcota bacterium]|nr:hypothetical protein [Myxococcota bacterium]
MNLSGELGTPKHLDAPEHCTMQADLDHVAHMLLKADGPSLDTIRRALTLACDQVASLTQSSQVHEAQSTFLSAVGECGSLILDGSSPQILEDFAYRTHPDSALEEVVLRRAWITVSEEVSRVSGKPVFGGDGCLESWAMTACVRPWPYAEPSALQTAMEKVGSGQQLVIVRGPGRAAFLAALRRRCLADADVLIPPVISAARDEVGGLIRGILAESELPAELKDVLPKLNLSEDIIGLFGRLGEHQPVALCLDNAHLQARSMILGLPIFLEPSKERNATLICAAPDSPADDGALADVIADAQARGMLTEIHLPPLDDEEFVTLWSMHGGKAGDPRIGEVLSQLAGIVDHDLRKAAARAWCEALAASDDETTVETELKRMRDVLPKHPSVRTLLLVAAHEGLTFHGASVASVLSRSDTDVEDILHDDEFEIDGQRIGGCAAVVPLELSSWGAAEHGLIQRYSFGDARYVAELIRDLPDERRQTIGTGLFDALLDAYGREGLWKVASCAWRLAETRPLRAKLMGLMMGPLHSERSEAAFRRFLPVLTLEENYHLGLSRLYGAGMEAGTVGVSNGKPAIADQAFQAAAAAARRLGRGAAAGEALGRLGELRLALALPEPARAALSVATRLLDGPEHRTSRARIGLLVAEISILEGDFQRAANELAGIVDELLKVEDWSHQALALMRLGRVLYEQGLVDEAKARLQSAMDSAERSGDLRAIGAARLAMAFPCAESNRLDDAFQHLKKGAEAFEQTQLPVHLFELQAADLQRRNGQPDEALSRFSRVAEAFKQAKAAIQWSEAKHGEIRCLMDCGRLSEAHEAVARLKALRIRARDRFGLVRLMVDEGDINLGLGDPGAACLAYLCAQELSERYGLRLTRVVAEARLETHRSDFDKAANVNVDALHGQAVTAVDELDAEWQSAGQVSAKTPTLH